MATRTIIVHDRCTTEGCGKVLKTISEGERGTCATCWFDAMPSDTKRSLGNLISAAFKKTSDSEKTSLVQDTLGKLKRDREQGS